MSIIIAGVMCAPVAISHVESNPREIRKRQFLQSSRDAAKSCQLHGGIELLRLTFNVGFAKP